MKTKKGQAKIPSKISKEEAEEILKKAQATYGKKMKELQKEGINIEKEKEGLEKISEAHQEKGEKGFAQKIEEDYKEMQEEKRRKKYLKGIEIGGYGAILPKEAPLCYCEAFGKVFVLRGKKKMQLKQGGEFVEIKRGDRIITGDCSYASINERPEHYCVPLGGVMFVLFPNSEAKILSVREGSVAKMEFVKGLFAFKLLGEGEKDAIVLPLRYPQVKFGPEGPWIETAEDAYKGATGEGVEEWWAEMRRLDAQKVMEYEKKKNKRIISFIELNNNGSLTIFGSWNRINHKGIGKRTRLFRPGTVTDKRRQPFSEKFHYLTLNNVKVTLTNNALYEIDLYKHPDQRINTALMIPFKLYFYRVYTGIEGYSKEATATLEDTRKQSEKEVKESYENALQNLKVAEEIGDPTLIKQTKEEMAIAKSRMKEPGIPKYSEAFWKQQSIKGTEKFLNQCKKKGITAEDFKKELESPLPGYSPLREEYRAVLKKVMRTVESHLSGSARYGGIEFQLTKVEKGDKWQWSKAPAGKEYLMIYFKATNKGKRQAFFDPQSTISLLYKDELIPLKDYRMETSIDPGGVCEGQFFFRVPEEAKSFVLQFGKKTDKKKKLDIKV